MNGGFFTGIEAAKEAGANGMGKPIPYRARCRALLCTNGTRSAAAYVRVSIPGERNMQNIAPH